MQIFEVIRIFIIKNEDRNVQALNQSRKDNPAVNHKCTKIVHIRRSVMQAMKASLFMERYGHAVFNACLLASLPAAALAILLQGF